MHPSTVLAVLLSLLSLLFAHPASAARRGAVNDALEDFERRGGPWPLWVDREAGAVYVELPAPPDDGDGFIDEMLLVSALQTGLGSNPVGLDRGRLREPYLVHLIRSGDKVLIEAQNTTHRAITTDPAEQRATRESFATSVLGVMPVVASDDERLIVDPRGQLVQDARWVSRALAIADQGPFVLDESRSLVLPDETHAFPDNLALGLLATYRSGQPGAEVIATTPEATAVTLRLAQLWVRLPSVEGFVPRLLDPRTGYFGPEFYDHAAPIRAPLQTGFAARHRMDEPIVYYVDPGAPEPVRSALIEGASWWAGAFVAAGRPDAFRVEILPQGAHPLDVRYNVIQWVHRATRGWSYGNAIVDPRTGEIFKGHVTLGSQRIRHDRLLFEALLGADATGTGGLDDPEQLALARIRQLSAHEVGHTLGLMHNFAASIDGGSVMDYPAPRLRLFNGSLDASAAYSIGVGPWDIANIVWGYGPGDPRSVEDAAVTISRHPFVTDRDARSPGSAHPLGLLWDTGSEPAAALEQLLEARAAALSAFGPDRIAAHRPLSELRDAFGLIYLLHRYQVTAAARQLGGVYYAYATRAETPEGVPDAPAGAVGDAVAADAEGGPGQAISESTTRPVDAETQRRALAALLATLSPDALRISPAIADVLLPPPPGPSSSREHLRGRAGPVFDPLAAIGTAARMTVEAILEPDRLSRLAIQADADPDLPDPVEVIDALVGATFGGSKDEALRFEVRTAVLERMIAVASDENTAPGVRALLDDRLSRLQRRLSTSDPRAAWLRAQITRHAQRPIPPRIPLLPPPEPPPGPPIGGCGG